MDASITEKSYGGGNEVRILKETGNVRKLNMDQSNTVFSIL